MLPGRPCDAAQAITAVDLHEFAADRGRLAGPATPTFFIPARSLNTRRDAQADVPRSHERRLILSYACAGRYRRAPHSLAAIYILLAR